MRHWEPSGCVSRTLIFALVIRKDGWNCHLFFCRGGDVFLAAVAVDDSEPMVEDPVTGVSTTTRGLARDRG
jgi:hypothetical protein